LPFPVGGRKAVVYVLGKYQKADLLRSAFLMMEANRGMANPQFADV
jgi:hypothetical protein